MVARTVLDLRAAGDKYVSQVLLLAASWSRHARGDADLEVLTIGDPDRVLSGFFDEIGVRTAEIAPSANDRFSKNSNKIGAAYPDAAGRRVLLLDNDTCFFGGVAELVDLPADAIAAAEAGNVRVSDEQWELIRNELGLPLLRRTWAPLNQWAPFSQGRMAEADPAMCDRWLYLNSGVILLPAGHDHRASWLDRQRAIHDFFRGHPLASDAVTSSDQAGFASSVAACRDFAWLPAGYNYRPPCFRLGLVDEDGIRIAHFTDDAGGLESPGIMERMRDYWNRKILRRIDALPREVADAEKARRRAIAMAALDKVAAIVDEYALEARLDAHRRMRFAQMAT